MSLREVALFLPLIAWAIWIGVYPKPYFDLLEKPVQQTEYAPRGPPPRVGGGGGTGSGL
jgi:NADH:ubiquinone oxidoreductase subunit 4 (subunit M)